MLSQGLHRNVPMRDYIGDPCEAPSLSKGIVRAIVERSVAHAVLMHPRLSVVEDSASRATDLGSAAHAAYLYSADSIVWIDAEDWRTKAAKEERDAARAAGKCPLLVGQRPQIESMAAAARLVHSPGIGDVEVTLVWQERGVWLRCRPDILAPSFRGLPGSWVPDYKTCATCHPQTWARRSLYAGGYDIQAALCRRGLRVVTGEDWTPCWIVGETEAPYSAVVIAPSPEMLSLADAKVDAAIDAWDRMLQTGARPSYEVGPHWIDPPAWAGGGDDALTFNGEEF
jgi:hypothetical protein